VKIKRTAEHVEIDVKRFYLPYEVTSTCPQCGKEETTDLSVNYLSYPSDGETEISFSHCEDEDDEDEDPCTNEWSEVVVLAITLTYQKAKEPPTYNAVVEANRRAQHSVAVSLGLKEDK